VAGKVAQFARTLDISLVLTTSGNDMSYI